MNNLPGEGNGLSPIFQPTVGNGVLKAVEGAASEDFDKHIFFFFWILVDADVNIYTPRQVWGTQSM
jgi:hypothetical protein